MMSYKLFFNTKIGNYLDILLHPYPYSLKVEEGLTTEALVLCIDNSAYIGERDTKPVLHRLCHNLST